MFRLGHKWHGCEGHTLAFFADSAIKGTGVLVWDLTAGTQFTAPLITAQRPWTGKMSTEQRLNAAEDLELEIGDKVTIMQNLEA